MSRYNTARKREKGHEDWNRSKTLFIVNINFILKKNLRNLFLKNTRSNKFLWQGLRVEGQGTKLNLCLYIFARKKLEYERLNTVNWQPFPKYAIKLN